MSHRCTAIALAAGLGLATLAAGPATAAGPPPGSGGQASAASRPGAGTGWVGTWETAMTRDTATDLTGTTIRNVARISVGGTSVRVRLSNAFGTEPLVVEQVTIALQAAGDDSPRAVWGTMRTVRFDGAETVTVPAGEDAVSDPAALVATGGSDLMVSLDLAGSPGPATHHALAGQTSYVAPGGDAAADVRGAGYTEETTAWYYLTGIDVRNFWARGAVVALGDSITDGYCSTLDANARWPDVLAGRLAELPVQRQYGVLNAGISGNRLLLDGMIDSFGVNALDRLESDVLSRTGVRTVILLEGINDIQQDPHQLDAMKIVAAYEEIADRLHAEGIRLVGATMTPFEGWDPYDADLEATRQAVNAFIRTSPVFDAVVDFDRVLRDPDHPSRMLPAYDSGDHLHPNDAGYAAMSLSIDLRQL